MKSTIRETRMVILAGLFAALVIAPAVVQAKRIPVRELPEAVKAAALAVCPKGAEIKRASTEKEHGVTVFEVKVKTKKEKFEIEVTPEGKVIEIEQEISVEAVPQAVLDAVKARYGSVRIEEAEKITKGKVVSYEVEFEVGNREIEMEVAASGKVGEVEEEDDDDDEHEHDDDDD